MNKITFLLLFVLCISILKAQEGDLNFDEYQYDVSVNWFNDANISDVPFFHPYPQPFTGGEIYFGLTDISSAYLDMGVALNSSGGVILNPPVIFNYYRKGTWNTNNGNGSFGNPNNYYIDETYSGSQNINKINGCVFVKLRDGQSRSDLVVGRGQTNGVWVHWNNGSVGNVQQMLNANANQIEKAKFSSEDTREDVIVKDGNTIRVFRNQGNGYLEDNYPTFSFLQTTIVKFKFKQMNDKDYDAGYWPNNENDRSDLIVLSKLDPFYPKVKVFMNTNSNNFNDETPLWTLAVPYNTYNFEVGDVDADGYNDILISGNFGVKIYKNVQGQFINTTPIWSNDAGIGTSQMVIEDINKDGWARPGMCWG